MALQQFTVVTPENLKSVLTEVFNDYTSKLDTKLSVILAERYNSITLTSSTTTVSIGISSFDHAKDILHVYKDGVLLESGYTVSSDNLSVIFDTAISATSEVPVVIKFGVIEGSIVVNS